MLVKRLEGVMRRLGSPLPATTLQAQRNSQLVQLLSCVATAVAVSAAAAAAHKRLARPLPACWQPTGPLAQKLQLALQQCGGQLAEACKRLEGLFPAEEQRLRQLAAALHAYRAATGSPELGASLLRCAGGLLLSLPSGCATVRGVHCAGLLPTSLPAQGVCFASRALPAWLDASHCFHSPLCSCMRSVQQLFLNAFLAVGEVVRATQAAAATRGMRSVSMAAAEALFDDDLDMAGRTTGAPRCVVGEARRCRVVRELAAGLAHSVSFSVPPSALHAQLGANQRAPHCCCRPGGTAPGAAAAPSVSSPASLVSACKTRCAALLCMLGPLDPGNASQAAEFWLSKAHEAGQVCWVWDVWHAYTYTARHKHPSAACKGLRAAWRVPSLLADPPMSSHCQPLHPFSLGNPPSAQVLPEEGFLLLADTLVQCCVRAMTADPAAAAKYGGSACRALGLETHGVLSWSPRYHNARCLFAVERVRAMAEAAAAAVAARGAPAAAVLRPLLVELAGGSGDQCCMSPEVQGCIASHWYCIAALVDGRGVVPPQRYPPLTAATTVRP